MDPDQIADLDLQCLKKIINLGQAGQRLRRIYSRDNVEMGPNHFVRKI